MRNIIVRKGNCNPGLYDGFDAFFRPFFFENGLEMKSDIKELENAYQIDVELPGVDKGEIELSLENGYLEIAVKKSEEKKEENDRFLRRERKYGAASRSYYVGEHVTEEDLKASFANGVLAVTFPKVKEKAADAKKKIQIE